MKNISGLILIVLATAWIQSCGVVSLDEQQIHGFRHPPAFGNLVGTNQETFGQLRWFTQIGIGAKYQLTQSVGVEVSYGNFLNSRNDGAGQVVNLGIRIIN